MFALNRESKTNIKYVTGLDVEEISSMSVEEQIKYIEKNKGIKFQESQKFIVAGRKLVNLLDRD